LNQPQAAYNGEWGVSMDHGGSSFLICLYLPE
jgi:hypothetical protein